jgi:hypothetical protein
MPGAVGTIRSRVRTPARRGATVRRGARASGWLEEWLTARPLHVSRGLEPAGVRAIAEFGPGYHLGCRSRDAARRSGSLCAYTRLPVRCTRSKARERRSGKYAGVTVGANAGVRRARRSVWTGDRPPVLLVVARPRRIRSGNVHNDMTPIHADQFWRAYWNACTILSAFLVLGHRQPGVRRVHLVGRPAPLCQPDASGRVTTIHHHLAQLFDATKVEARMGEVLQ